MVSAKGAGGVAGSCLKNSSICPLVGAESAVQGGRRILEKVVQSPTMSGPIRLGLPQRHVEVWITRAALQDRVLVAYFPSKCTQIYRHIAQ
ncbi:MAG: hypothetical protein M3Y42_15380 [Actinomycetota bacterium]|nr:hypothetical protein [Actinomycetota bacterium]MDQ2958335.1 hypothetical protein [Actinomycetota bacterium]